MRFTSLLLASGFVLSAAAHGFIKEYIIDGVSYVSYPHRLPPILTTSPSYPGYDPYLDNPLPELNRTTAPPRIAYSISDNGPVYDVTHPNITCSYNPIRSAPPLVAPVTAGSNITLFYTPWPTNHFGSIFFYLARCPGDDCTNYYAPEEGAEWFKVAQWAKEEDGSNEWVTERFIAENSTWTVPVPRDIEQGEYVARMEMISLHAVGVPEYGAEVSDLKEARGEGC